MDEGILELSGAAAVEAAASALAGRGAKTGRCANCETTTIGPYCAYCGQERDTHRRSVAGLLHDFFVDLVNVDSRILRTIYALLLKPGELALAFRQGRTVRYLPAMRLYLFTSLIFFLTLSATKIALMQLEVVATPQMVLYDAKGDPYIKNPAYDGPSDLADGIKPTIKLKKNDVGKDKKHFNFSTRIHFFSRIGTYHSDLSQEAKDRLQQSLHENDAKAHEDSSFEKNLTTTMRNLAADPAALNGPLTTWIPRVLFLLLPGYALLLTLFYWRKRKDFYFVDHLVFSLGIHTFAFVLLLLAATAAQVMRAEYVAFAMVVIAGVYVWLAMKRFYEQGWFWTTFKFAFVSFVYLLFFVLPALIGVLVLSVYGGSFG